MSLETRIYTWLFGAYVGADAFGNRYYQSRSIPKQGRRRRWVVYKGIDEPSKVPAEWHGWLHYTTDDVPSGETKRYAWQKEHRPNLTSTEGAYYPPGHVLRGGKRQAATGDYQPWQP